MCSLECGIFMRSASDFACEQELVCVEHISACPATLRGDEVEVFSGHRIVVWTDGACPNNDVRYLRRAGCGVFYGREHPRNRQYALPGPEQTNQRAELHACIVALEGEDRAVELRTDSKYVVDGVMRHALWCRVGWRGDNVDLWDVLFEILIARGDQIRVVKVKGHAESEDVERGRVDPTDKWGNDAADGLAVSGAASHAVPADVVETCAARFAQAQKMQSVMLRILASRRLAEERLGLPRIVEPEDEADGPVLLRTAGVG